MNRYREKIKLSLIIYMHRISDRYMSGSLSRSFDLFNRLCGDRAIEHVRFVTSMWDVKVDEIGSKRREDRESELTSNFWKPLIDAGRELNTKGSKTPGNLHGTSFVTRPPKDQKLYYSRKSW